MLKPEQVPYDAVRAAYAAWAGGGGNNVLSAMENAIAAALNAWPGMYTDDETMYGKVIGKTIFLPLPTEASDE